MQKLRCSLLLDGAIDFVCMCVSVSVLGWLAQGRKSASRSANLIDDDGGGGGWGGGGAAATAASAQLKRAK